MQDEQDNSQRSPVNRGNNNHISAPSLTVTFGDHGTKVVRAIIFAVVLVVIIFLMCGGATGLISLHASNAAEQADRREQQFERTMTDRFNINERENRQLGYWSEQVAVECLRAGVKVPTYPADYRK